MEHAKQDQDHLVSPVPCEARTTPLPCPFCGGAPEFENTDERARLRCIDCGAEGGLFFYSQEECDAGIGDETEARAVAAWNRRAPADPVWCGCGDGIMPDTGAKCGTCAAIAEMYAEDAPRRDAADTEPHGSDELTPESAPGESADPHRHASALPDPQSQGDTQ